MNVELLNRPMIDADMSSVETNIWSTRIREMVGEYTAAGLPVMNGSLLYSNIREGEDQILTCNPYRLWEYSSLFLAHAPEWQSFLDVGGAASVLPYLLAEIGIRGEAFDLQPFLAAACNHAAGARGIPLAAFAADVVDRDPVLGQVDLVTCISVLEHIPEQARTRFLSGIHRVLAPQGLFYLTFDYGSYVERDSYRQERGEPQHEASSIGDLEALCTTMKSCGFEFLGNDPRDLPVELIKATSAPQVKRVMRRFGVTTRPFDIQTPWSDVAKYLVKRLLPLKPSGPARFERHNFFRMFLRKR